MPTYNYQFGQGAGAGVNAVPGYGDRWNIVFGGTWAFGDGWRVDVTSTQGDFTLGSGNLFFKNTGLSIAPLTVCFTYRDRVYMGDVSRFVFSDNGDPTGWEEQNPGAGFVDYLSQYGSQDTIAGFGQLQGRLAVVANRSIQLWQPDADPNNFQLIQILDNSGTFASDSIQQLGDYDVLYLDPTGVRSIRAKEVTLNAEVDDVGAPIDEFIQLVLQTFNTSTAPSIVEPLTKNYWLFLKNTFYVLSRHRSSKVLAWSTYEPRGDDNFLFTPSKIVILNNRIYLRANNAHDGLDYLYKYGGSSNATYDQYTIVTWQTPYMEDKKPGMLKQFAGLSMVKAGKWTISLSADPQSNSYVPFLQNHGNASAPNSLTDSTYDIGNIEGPLRGSHFSIQGVSTPASASLPATFSSLLLYYNPAETTG